MDFIGNSISVGGIFKDVWGESVFDALKYLTPIMSDLQLETAKEAGGLFHQPVMLQLDHGITHARAGIQPGYNGTSYVQPRVGLVPDAKIAGVQTYARGVVGYEAMMDSLAGLDGLTDMASKRKAVASATKVVMNSIGKSAALRGEIHALHGGSQNGIGVIEAVSSVVATNHPDGTAGQAVDVRITAAEFSRGLWAYALGATVDLLSIAATPAKANSATNTHLTGLGGATSTALEVIDLNPATLLSGLTGSNERVVRLWHSATTNGASSAAAGQAIFFETGVPAITATGPTEMLGIDVLARVGSGETGMVSTVHGLNSAQYALWKGNYVSGAGVTRLDSLLGYMEIPFSFGVMGMKYRAVVSGKQFAVLASDEAALRRYPDSNMKAKNGFASLEFVGMGGNVVEILAHPFQKDGKITCYPVDEVHRVGSQDLTFLKRTGDGFTLDVGQGAAAEVRAQGKYNIYADCNRHLLSINDVTF